MELFQEKSFRLLTVDVWDTLLRRRCHPDSVKLEVARYLLQCWEEYLYDQERNPWRLLRLRQQAEKELGDEGRRKGQDDEYIYPAVCDRWLELAGVKRSLNDNNAYRKLVEELSDRELSQEMYVTYPDPQIESFLSGFKAEQKIFLSDFYMPSSVILRLLKLHKLDHLVDGGLVSCEVGLNKRSGRLFSYVQEKYGISSAEHLHIGDNPYSDFQVPKQLGIKCLHFLPGEEHEKRLRIESQFLNRNKGIEEAVIESATSPEAEDNPIDARLYGRKTALLWVGFVFQTVEKALKNNDSELYFFTREGEFYLKIYQALAKEKFFRFNYPEAKKLEVSRIATFGPSLPVVDIKNLMRLWNQYSSQSPAAFITSLGVNPNGCQEYFEKYDLVPTEVIRYPWLDQRVKSLLEDRKFQKLIQDSLSSARRNLIGYLSQQGISPTSSRNVGIVDIGWRGTIQDNLAYLFPNLRWNGYYLALEKYLNPQPTNVTKTAWGPDRNLTDSGGYLLSSVTPLEMLSNSPGGSVLGYYEECGQFYAKKLVDADENKIFDKTVKHYQAGVLDTLPFWINFLQTYSYTAEEIRLQCLQIWSDIVSRPPTFLADAYFQLKHNETFGPGCFISKNQNLSTMNILSAGFSSKHRASLRHALENIGWTPALFQTSRISSSVKLSLMLALQAKRIKNIINSNFLARN